MQFRWQFLLIFMVHVWTHRFPRWLWNSQPGNPSCQKQYLKQEVLPLEKPVQELNHINQPILFYFFNGKKWGKEKRNGCCLSNKGISDWVHALIFSTGGIQSLSSFPLAFWDSYYAPSSASSLGISACCCFSSLSPFHWRNVLGRSWPPAPSLLAPLWAGSTLYQLWPSLPQISAFVPIPPVMFAMRWVDMTIPLSPLLLQSY